MSTVVNIGHTIACAIAFLDANGNPMLAPVKPDAPPSWSNTTAATDTIKASADGLSCEVDPVAPGTDTLSMTVTVAGQAFPATLAIEVDPAPQVLTSVQIVPTVN